MKLASVLSIVLVTLGSQANCNDFYTVNKEEDLEMIRHCPTSAFTLEQDILVTKTFDPINSFYGVLDGKKHKITNITINSEGYFLGLFRIFAGTVRDIELDIHITSIQLDTIYIGGFAGYLSSQKITNTNVTSWISGGKDYCETCPRKIIGGFCGATNEFPDNVRVYTTIQLTLMNAYVGGMAGIVGIEQRGSLVETIAKTVTNLTGNMNIRCMQSACYAGALFGMTFQSISNSNFTGRIHVTGSSLENGIVGGAVGILAASMTNVQGMLDELYVSTCGIAVVNYVGGLIGYGNTTSYLQIQIDSCNISITNFHTDYTIDYTAGIIAYSKYLFVSRSVVNIEKLTSCLSTGGVAGFSSITEFKQCMVTVNEHTRFNCALLPQKLLNKQERVIFGGVLAMGTEDTVISQCIINFTFINGNFIEKFMFGGIIGTGTKYLVNSTAAAYGQINLKASNIINSTITFGGLAGSTWLTRDYLSIIYNSYVVYGVFNVTLSCLEHNNSAVIGGLVGSITQWYDIFQSNLTVRSSYVVMNASFYSKDQCLTSSTFLYGGLFGLSYGDIYFYNTYIQASIAMQMVRFKDFSPSGVDAYGIGSLLGKAFLSHTSIKGALINLTFEIIKTDAVSNLAIPLYAGTSEFNNCLLCQLIYIVQNKYIISNEFTINKAMSTLQTTYHFNFLEESEWFFHINRPMLRALPNFILEKVTITPGKVLTWGGNNVINDKMSHIGWDCMYTFRYDQSSTFKPLLDLQYAVNDCAVPNCRHCKSGDSSYCSSCILSYYAKIGSKICFPCPQECAMCGTIKPFPLSEDPSTCVTCPLGTLVPISSVDNLNRILCVLYEGCNVPYCLRCSTNSISICLICSIGYYHNLEGFCIPCPPYCPLCSSSAGCMLCKDYDNLPISGLCLYNTIKSSNDSLCVVSIINNPNLCIACTSSITGKVYRPNENWECKEFEPSCKISGCFSCLINSEVTCKICQGGYVLNEATKSCDRCEAGCKVCRSSFQCVECLHGYTLMNGSCSATTKCSKNFCQYCDVYNPIYCFKCNDSYIIDREYGLCVYKEVSYTKSRIIIPIVVTLCILIAAVIIIVPTVLVYRKRRQSKVETIYDQQLYVEEMLGT